ncbi:hypothetical protein CsSME_00020413 [Camellia sinensis var. sinensis]
MNAPPQLEDFKHRVVVDSKYADMTWKNLEHAIHEIYNHNTSGLCMEDLYRGFSDSLVWAKLFVNMFMAWVFFLGNYLPVVAGKKNYKSVAEFVKFQSGGV